MGNSFDQVFRGTALTAAGGAGLDVADVFSTFLYTGNGTARSITNGIDLAGEGYPVGNGTRFDSTGFSIGPGGAINGANVTRASWTFRKAPKFFDIVTYTGDGNATLINHNLGSVPGMIIVKCTSEAGPSWPVFHRALDGSAAEDYVIHLRTTAARADGGNHWYNFAPTATQFKVGPINDTNTDGYTYVAYIFAHNNNDGEFGPDADQDIISCGSYTGNGSGTGPVINLGWEPQWLLVKDSSASNDWFIWDVMRGLPSGVANSSASLNPNKNDAEQLEYGTDLQGTGFQIKDNNAAINTNNNKYIYMAIRAPMITPPAAATDVFDITAYTGNGATNRSIGGLLIDMNMLRTRDGNHSGNDDFHLWDRLRGPAPALHTSTNGAEETDWSGTYYNIDQMTGWRNGSDATYFNNNTGTYISYIWKRAKGYMDCVAYTGTGANRTVAHSLGVVPEMMWIKNRETAIAWAVYHKDLGNAKALFLNDDQAEFSNTSIWNSTTPTDTNFTLGTYGNAVNQSSKDFIAYLFATLDGISKVGSVSHSGSSTDVNCGFSNGARFVMLKRNDGQASWYVWDSVRGIIAGNDPYVIIDTDAVETTNTDFIDPLSSGFQISGDFTDGDYIFYAIA